MSLWLTTERVDAMNPMRLDTREPTRIAFGMGSGGGTGIDVLPAGELDSTAQLATAEVGALATHVRLAGRISAGDGGGAVYRRVAADPGHAGSVQSADGAWWEIVPENDTLNVRQFGALDDGTAVEMAIQAAIDTANTLATGGKRITVAVNGVFSITASVAMKANVHLTGPGLIQRQNYATATGAAFALVTADGVDDWKIQGLGLRNVSHARVRSGDVTTASTFGGSNAAIAVRDCDDLVIDDCFLSSQSIGIIIDGLTRFRITGNNIDAQSGQTVADMIAGTYTPVSSGNPSGGIITLTDNGSLQDPSTDGVVSGNIIQNAGHDIGIMVLNQYFDRANVVISDNVVIGGNCGIQAYRGTTTDPGSAPTYRTDLVVANNTVQYTWEQGIYFRSVLGCTISDNQLYRTGMGGDNGSASSACAITIRNDPEVNGTKFTSLSAGDVSHDHPILVIDNRITDHGQTGADNDNNVIQIEIRNTVVRGNTITRSAEFSTNAGGIAINIIAAKDVLLEGVRVEDNEITGTFTVGINADRTTNACNRAITDWGSISGNRLRGSYTIGINVTWGGFNLKLDNNDRFGTFSTAGISIRNAVWSSLSGSKVVASSYTSGASGIRLRSGCLLSDQPFYMTASEATPVARTNRRGGTLDLTDNKVIGFGTSYEADDTDAFIDSDIYGRCREFRDNFADGALVTADYSGGTTTTTSAQTWFKHQVAPNSAATAAAAPGKYCTASGQYGDTTTTTGDSTNASAVISNIASMDGVGVGYMFTMPNFTGTVTVIEVTDAVAGTILVDKNASATATTQTMTPVAPTFATLAALT